MSKVIYNIIKDKNFILLVILIWFYRNCMSMVSTDPPLTCFKEWKDKMTWDNENKTVMWSN